MQTTINLNHGDKPHKARWGVIVFKADPQKVADELLSINNGSFTAQEAVDFAKDPNTELHGCLEWDDAKAANAHRCSQIRSIVANLKITVIHEDKDPEDTDIRVFSMVERKCGEYKKTEVIVQNADEYQKLLSNAKAELKAFKNKYKRLSELEEVFEAIDRL